MMGEVMRCWVVGLAALTVALAGCGPTKEQQAILTKAAKQAESDAAREKEDGPLKAEALKKIGDALKDPSSAQFRNVEVRRIRIPATAAFKATETVAVCGEVNGKNGYGGYAGFTPFFYTRSVSVEGKLDTTELYGMLQADSSRDMAFSYIRFC